MEQTAANPLQPPLGHLPRKQKRGGPALWFEDPSESTLKAKAYYEQCNELEFGSRSAGRAALKVSIDSTSR